ncbi:MFS transporter [Planctomycetales bacterium ZRK34]|nr:MFS transporter [Planctomycetales bacterium ZRK34]
MIFRFSAYGFLKNLRLFEAFLILALRERGLDFLAIGSLIAVREITVNVFEVPSGSLADALGRKRCMVASMACYIVAYLVLGLAGSFGLLAGAMVFYGIGDAFRTGTHKALIYAWLRSQGRANERTKVYGYTRSWSKMGSAVSALLAGLLVFFSGSYTSIFLWSAAPAALNLVNLATYPSWLDDHGRNKGRGLKHSAKMLGEAIGFTTRQPAMRRLVADSMIFEGSYAVIKDYLQPVIQSAAITLPIMFGLKDQQRTAVMIGVVYALLYLLASVAARRAHQWEDRCGGTEPGIRGLYVVTIVALVGMGASLAAGWAWPAIGLFIVLGVAQNLWRPIHVGRFDLYSPEHHAATTLSIESQAKSVATAVMAPLIGWAIDRLSHHATPAPVWALWPVAVCAAPMLVRLLFVTMPSLREPEEPEQAATPH